VVEELEDVDGSLFCEMAGAYGRLVLKNSEYVDALWIESDFDIDPFFE
jgi:hypothetical protein